GERREQPPSLGRVPDAEARDLEWPPSRDVPALEHDAAAPSWIEAERREQRGGLAHAVPAEQRDGLTAPHLERDVPQDRGIAVARGHGFERQHRPASAATAPPPPG